MITTAITLVGIFAIAAVNTALMERWRPDHADAAPRMVRRTACDRGGGREPHRN